MTIDIRKRETDEHSELQEADRVRMTKGIQTKRPINVRMATNLCAQVDVNQILISSPGGRLEAFNVYKTCSQAGWVMTTLVEG
jgi:hypothetical protein